MTDAVVARLSRERRVSRSRRSLEMLLDAMFRPGDWAARASRALGLQGRLRQRNTTLSLARRRGDAPPLRIAFASDFHAGATTHDRTLAEACRALAALEPDVLLLGGDFVSVRASYMQRLTPFLAAIHAPLGKFAVLGNHDVRANQTLVAAGLREAGVRLLMNENVRLPAPHDDVWICGLDDPTTGRAVADEALADAAGVRVVLMHSPDGLLELGLREFDIALCGHTHGGQVTTPSGRAILLPNDKLSRQYLAGEFDLPGGHGTMLVSRGVGCSTMPVRLFATPEIHLVRLQGRAAADAEAA